MEETEDIHVEVTEDVATQQRRREEHEAPGGDLVKAGSGWGPGAGFHR